MRRTVLIFFASAIGYIGELLKAKYIEESLEFPVNQGLMRLVLSES